MMFYRDFDGPMGKMFLTASERALTGLWFYGQKYQGQPQPGWHPDPAHPLLRQACVELSEYFSGARQQFQLPVAPIGTAFQESVWQALLRIPFGRTMTYGELARDLGKPNAVRAAAAAVGRNPISVIVPCHRILGADGSLTGYAGGLERKQDLLTLENVPHAQSQCR